VFRALLERGYDAVPINPNGSEVEGRPCMRRLSELPGPVEGALLLTPPTATAEAVRDCMAAGVRRVWMHRGAGRGAVSPDAVAFCRERGIEVVDGACPFMFLPETSLFHRIHGFFHRLSGGLSA
jgi:predicted CoA-binding protein